MIHHVSIPARDPKHVADVLAELMNGRAYPFPGSIADSFMAVSGDAHGTMIEVYPETLALKAGTTDDEQVKATKAEAPAAYPATARAGARSCSAAARPASRRCSMCTSSGSRTV
jgi:hypothetical protein